VQPDSTTLDGSRAVAIFSDTGALTGEFVFPLNRKRWVEKYDANVTGNEWLSREKRMKNNVLRAETSGNIKDGTDLLHVCNSVTGVQNLKCSMLMNIENNEHRRERENTAAISFCMATGFFVEKRLLLP